MCSTSACMRLVALVALLDQLGLVWNRDSSLGRMSSHVRRLRIWKTRRRGRMEPPPKEDLDSQDRNGDFKAVARLSSRLRRPAAVRLLSPEAPLFSGMLKYEVGWYPRGIGVSRRKGDLC